MILKSVLNYDSEQNAWQVDGKLVQIFYLFPQIPGTSALRVVSMDVLKVLCAIKLRILLLLLLISNPDHGSSLLLQDASTLGVDLYEEHQRCLSSSPTITCPDLSPRSLHPGVKMRTSCSFSPQYPSSPRTGDITVIFRLTFLFSRPNVVHPGGIKTEQVILLLLPLGISCRMVTSTC